MVRRVCGYCFRIIPFIFFLLYCNSFSFVLAKEPDIAAGLNRGYIAHNTAAKESDKSLKKNQEKKEPLSGNEIIEKKEQARSYRLQGVDKQNSGDLLEAMKLYTMATELDPEYTEAYCDLGIIYEAYGIIDEAERAYLKALEIDPGYLNVYSDLALLYESKRDFTKAIYYWGKRIELGLPDDPWTNKAKQRLSFLLEGKQNNYVHQETIKAEIPFKNKIAGNEDREKQGEETADIGSKNIDVEHLGQKEPVTLVREKPDDFLLKQKAEDIVGRDHLIRKQEPDYSREQKNTELLDKEEKILFMSQQLESLKQEIVALKGQKEIEDTKKNEEINSNNQEIDSLKKEFGNLILEKEEKIAERDREILSMNQQVESLKQKVANLSRQKEVGFSEKEREISAKAEQLKSLLTSLRNNIHSYTNSQERVGDKNNTDIPISYINKDLTK